MTDKRGSKKAVSLTSWLFEAREEEGRGVGILSLDTTQKLKAVKTPPLIQCPEQLVGSTSSLGERNPSEQLSVDGDSTNATRGSKPNTMATIRSLSGKTSAKQTATVEPLVAQQPNQRRVHFSHFSFPP